MSVLGLSWTPSLDIFQLKVEFEPITKPSTKRTILSTISKIFDPLGLATPVTVCGKLILQRVWKEGLVWDVPVSDEIESEFKAYVNDLNQPKLYSCPRYIGTPKSCHLIGFADTSEQAYYAVVYLSTGGRTQLYYSKTRVVPVKALTIP